MNADFVAKVWPHSVHPYGEMADALNQTFDEWEISSNDRRAAFLSQMAYETGGFTKLEEDLKNFSASRLRAVFPWKFFAVKTGFIKRNPKATAAQISAEDKRLLEKSIHIAGKPEATGDFVYGGLYGNGPEGSGDGYKFRGRGWTHLTFHDNYRDAGNATGVDLVKSPDLAMALPHCARVAGWFWNNRGCNKLADAADITGITKAINGGKNGLAERIGLWVRLRSMDLS